MKTKYNNQKHKIIQLPKHSKQFLDLNYKENISNLKEYFKSQYPQREFPQGNSKEKISLVNLLSFKRPSTFNEQSTSYQSSSQMNRLSASKPSKYNTMQHILDQQDKATRGQTDLSQLETKYNEKLNEKDKVINELKAELAKCKGIMRKQQQRGHNKPLSIAISTPSKELKSSHNNKHHQVNKTFSERLSNYYTPKANNLLRSSITLTQRREEGLLSPQSHLAKSVKKTLFFNTPSTNSNNLNLLDQLRERTCLVLSKYNQIAQSKVQPK